MRPKHKNNSILSGFDSGEYCKKYKDVLLSGINPEEHFIRVGSKVGRNLLNNGPLISVIISIYKTPIVMLSDAIKSVISQDYKKWELILVDDFSESEEINELLEGFSKKDSRIKYLLKEENSNISASNNSGLNIATGDFFTILDHDDVLDQRALSKVAKVIQEFPDVDYIYSDEDKLSEDGTNTYGPFFKPDWSPEYMLAMMYTCHISVFRTELVKRLGGYRSKYDGAQDYDMTLRVISNTNKIVHIPEILYHWRVWDNSTAKNIDAKPDALPNARMALNEYLERCSDNYKISDGPLPGHFTVDFYPKDNPLVSIVIPTANKTIEVNGGYEYHIDAVVQSILNKTEYKNYEIIIVHNGDLLKDQISFFDGFDNIKLVYYDSNRFNLSEKINLGAKQAKGDYLLLLNDDIRIISPNWLTLMLGMVQREGVGVVGPKLLYPNETIQHAGVVMLGGLPGHAYHEEPKEAIGYALGAKVSRNYLAVTGACSITPKSLFDSIGGYSLKYPLNYNDVDYCIKAYNIGYRSVYLANVELYHYESVSKEGGRSVRDGEPEMFLNDWGLEFAHDPFYNPNQNQQNPYK